MVIRPGLILKIVLPGRFNENNYFLHLVVLCLTQGACALSKPCPINDVTITSSGPRQTVSMAIARFWAKSKKLPRHCNKRQDERSYPGMHHATLTASVLFTERKQKCARLLFIGIAMLCLHCLNNSQT